jgi:hypothetical protein
MNSISEIDLAAGKIAKIYDSLLAARNNLLAGLISS